MRTRAHVAVVALGLAALVVTSCAGASEPDLEPVSAPEAEVEPVEPDDEPDDTEDEAEVEVEEPSAPPPFDAARFTLTTTCTDRGAEAPVEVEVIDGVAELPDDDLRSVLNVEVVGETSTGEVVLFLDCWQTGASFNSSTSVEGATMLVDGALEQVELTGSHDGVVTGVDLDGDDALIMVDQPSIDTAGETTVRALRATHDGTGWTVAQDGPDRRALDGPGVRITVAQDSPWSWEYVDTCTGTLSAPSDGAWTVVYISGGGTDPAELDRLATAEGGRVLEPLPQGVVAGARATADGFDAVGQPALRDEVLVADEQGRLRWLVAIGGPADDVLDVILQNLELTNAPDDTFTQTGFCEPDDYVG